MHEISEGTLTTTPAWADIIRISLIGLNFYSYLIELFENGTGSIDFRIMGAEVDVDARYHIIFQDGDVEKVLSNAQTYETLSDAWNFLRVQVKDTVGGVHGVVTCIVSATP